MGLQDYDGKKVEAQNTWATAVWRYSLGTVDWCRSDMRKLDKSTRWIMRQNQAHQYGAYVVRIFQPRSVEGRGLVCLEHAWETETVATAAYLHSNCDPQVRQAMWYLEQVTSSNKNGLVMLAREVEEKYGLTDLFPKESDNSQTKEPGSTTKTIRAEERQGLREERAGKVIYGIYAAQADRKECDRTAMYT